MAGAKARFLELLRLRYSSPLFRLPTAAHIQRQLRFHDTGPQQASFPPHPIRSFQGVSDGLLSAAVLYQEGRLK